MKRPTTVLVSVTYGRRHEMCLEMIERATANGVDRIVLVCNGVADDSRTALSRAAEADPALTLVWHDRNLGTARAFAAGISAALAEQPTYVWILDDDNLAEDGCLDSAIALLESRRAPDDAEGPVISCFRDTDDDHQRIVSGSTERSNISIDGAFLGVDIVGRLTRSAPDAAAATDSHSLDQAPYGGLLARSEVYARIGLPRQDFVLYLDDVELTRRMVSAGVPILLSPESRITDAGEKWVDSSKNRYLAGMIIANSVPRSYYTFRNSFVLDRARARATGTRLRFTLNVAVYTAYVLANALKLRAPAFFALYVRACVDGATGRMGERVPLRTVEASA